LKKGKYFFSKRIVCKHKKTSMWEQESGSAIPNYFLIGVGFGFTTNRRQGLSGCQNPLLFSRCDIHRPQEGAEGGKLNFAPRSKLEKELSTRANQSDEI
jgi:hypothetical protein